MKTRDLIASAQQLTGLSDLGDTRIIEALDRLVDALNTEAKLSDSGKAVAEGSLIKALSNRLRVEQYLAGHPDILTHNVDKPMFVFGLPRTGTTLVINLLSVDPARRCFLRWEAFNPVPPPTPAELHAGPRFDEQKAKDDMAYQYMPHLAAIHHEYADSPTECQFAMEASFCAQVFDSVFDIPSYHHWFLHEADYMPAFEYQKRLLQLLQSQAPGRWTLKNPWHPLFLNELTTVYPDAQLVMTHRDPVDVVGSACSLLKAVRPIYSNEVDLKAIGTMILETFDTMIERVTAFKERHGWDSIYDLHYAAVMRNPIAELKAMYRHFDEPFTPAAEQAMTQYMQNNPQGKHGRHSYELADYGLTREQIRNRYRDYCSRFQIQMND